MNSSLVTRAALAGLLTLGAITQANAIPQLRLESSAGANLFVTDNEAGDSDADAGEITFMGAIAGWNTLTGGFSLPSIGSVLEPEIDLVSMNMSSSAGGTLNVWLTDTGFAGISSAHVLAAIGGTTQGTVTFRSFYDTTNTAFGTQHEITSQSFSPLGFSGEAAGEIASTTPYSLTLLVTIIHEGRQNTSFDALVKVPEPSSLLLLGAGLLAIGFAARRRIGAVAAV